MSEFVAYHLHSPDAVVPGCRNTGDENTDGVVFLNVEPMEGFDMFIGRPSIIAAVGELYNMTPNQVEDRLVRSHTRIKNLERELAEANELLGELSATQQAMKEALNAT